ncbi:unnamed protein product [Pleuronectes platessa]|uniref:Uncharacterized protein n=1 Tax=Pleuronectes platessa TaxID=8262 RepID=A0A9N7UXW2_PLEPL|nr:unnamed protein product [Pleuronectes platessa]
MVFQVRWDDPLKGDIKDTGPKSSAALGRSVLGTGTMQDIFQILGSLSERSLHGFVPVTPEAEAPRCAKAASRCFSLRCDRHKVLTWEWMGASCYLRLGAALKRPV